MQNFIRELPEKLFQMTDLTVIFLNVSLPTAV